MKKLIIILIIGCCLDFAVTTKSRQKRSTEIEDNLLFAITEIQEVGRAVLTLTANLETKVNEIKSELRKEVQDIRSESRKETNEIHAELIELKKQVHDIKTESRKETDEIKSEFSSKLQETNSKFSEINAQLLTMANGFNTKVEGIQGSINLKLKEQNEKSDLKLEKLDNKINATTILMGKIGDTILEQRNTSKKVDSQLTNLELKIGQCKLSLNSIDTTGKTILQKVNTTKEGMTKECKLQLNGGVTAMNKFLTPTKYFEKVIHNANGMINDAKSFLKEMAIEQLNETLKSVPVFENNIDVNSIQKIWPLLKTANFSLNSLPYYVLTKASGESRQKEWIVIQVRGVPLKLLKTREPFYRRNWTEYQNGFGSFDQDFWFGLDKIHDLTEAGFTELRIEMEDWEGNHAFAQYSHFRIAGSSDNYRLLYASGYSGTAGDSLKYSRGQQFSTVDRDNDRSPILHLASDFGGPWWYGVFLWGFFNGLNYDYQSKSKISYGKGIIWYTWKSLEYSLKKVQMKIRRPSN